MHQLLAIPDPCAPPVHPSVTASFAGPHLRCSLKGPARLVRLIQAAGYGMEGDLLRPSLSAGSFWFENSLFRSLLRQADTELRSQGNVTLEHRSVVAKLVLRDLLAIRKDWTENFDSFVTLQIPAGKCVSAVIGTVAPQPVYSPGNPGHATAQSAGIRLNGSVPQVVIDFSRPSNREAKGWIQGPFLL